MKKLLTVIAVTLTLVVLFANSSLAQTITPQGRLTLTSNTPVMTGDVVGASTVYYTPYIGNSLPDYNGSTFSNDAFSQYALQLDSTHQTAGNIYDIFWVQAPNPGFICTGPAWASSTSRGTGSGTTQLTQHLGVWVTANQLANCWYGPTSSIVGLAANYGIYLGSVYMTANGETSVQLDPTPVSGGENNVIGIWNAYNRVTVNARSSDDTSSWTYATNTWRSADNSTSNRITWVDGLQQSFVSATYDVVGINSSTTGYTNVGVGFNSTTGASGFNGQMQGPGTFGAHAYAIEYPQLGLSYVQALEIVGAGTETYYGNNLAQLTLQIEM